MYKRGSSKDEKLTIANGTCTLGGSIVGSPCKVEKDRTVITFNEVPDYELLVIESQHHTYTVYFAKDCKFPTPEDGEIIVEKSIPLYRFLGGKTEENVVFAMKGIDYTDISLWRDESMVCDWEDLDTVTGECTKLIVDKINGLVIFNATYSKTADKNYETLTWRRRYDVISVNLDWTNTGTLVNDCLTAFKI
ncbi:unnamed protein product [Hymenolepis diminuta]|uniref:DUF5727 domain-containing protein n=1 Tax=Hymenolepis diminuta TaxID=6216 RepID=A0A0R3SM67_HYMDI|nr:unnamed protein product [Hymenolepis diminuta]